MAGGCESCGFGTGLRALIAGLSLAVVVTSCGRDAGRERPAEAAVTPPAAAKNADGLTLSSDEIAKLGIVLTRTASTQYVARTNGFGIVVAHDVVAQAVTEVGAARAAVRQSRAALERLHRLSGTPGAETPASRESAERLAAADEAALSLAQAKAAATFGARSPWTQQTGKPFPPTPADRGMELVRVSFPLGAFAVGDPADLRLTRLERRPSETSWRITAVWPAPADPAIPGRSYFAIVEHSDLNAGERLLASAVDAAAAAPRAGVFVAASAVVVSGDRYWCYVRRGTGAFVRVSVDIGKPLAGGYFLDAGISPGEDVVTGGAGLLLAREMNPAADADP